MEQDRYAAPQADLIEEQNEVQVLASRWMRFWGSLIDSFTMMLMLVPIMFFTGGFEELSGGEQPSLGYNLVMGAIGLIAFLLVNGYLLTKYGQTLGKRLLGIKIVDLDGGIPNWPQHLIKRYAVFFVPGQIPIIGQFFSVINILFIFGKQKQCIHDQVAGTLVVESSASSMIPPTDVEFEKTDDVSENIRRYKEAQQNAVDDIQQDQSKQ